MSNTRSMTAVGSGGNPRRAYRSPTRQAQASRTRSMILTAAHDMFVAHGYATTSLRSVAAAAGVSVPTVEQNFGTKRRLLKCVVDVGKAGDDESIPLLQRAPARAAQAAATAEEFLRLVAQEIGTVSMRVAPLSVVVAQAAATHRDIAELAGELDDQRRSVASWIVERLQRDGLRPGLSIESAIDTVWVLLDPVVHHRLTHDRGWTTDAFSAWLVDSLTQLLLRSHVGGPPSG
jgi:AcrR family transcriptional regulator